MPWINKARCTGCGECIPVCVLEAIYLNDKKAILDMDKCHRCGGCHDVCPERAICYGEYLSDDQLLLPTLQYEA
jgi:heterodisulfide reductase subunit A-like polyferredoxin